MFTVDEQTILRQNHQFTIVLDLGGGTTSVAQCISTNGQQGVCGPRDSPSEKAPVV